LFIKADPKNDKRSVKGSPLLLILHDIWNDKEILEDETSADGLSVPGRREWFNPDNNRLLSWLSQLC